MLFNIRYYPSKSVRGLKSFAVDHTAGSDWRVLRAEDFSDDNSNFGLFNVMAKRELLVAEAAREARKAARKAMRLTEVTHIGECCFSEDDCSCSHSENGAEGVPHI
jgi:hypothetical protein